MEFLIEILVEVFGEILIESLRHATLPKWLRWSLITTLILGTIAGLAYTIYALGWVMLQVFIRIAALTLLIMIGYTIYYICRYGILRPAKKEELPEILKMYRSVIGKNGCHWTITYPNEATLYEDFGTRNLYTLRKGKKLVGSGSIVPKNELDDLDCWHAPENAREIARIVIKPEYQSKGLGKHFVRRLCARLRKEGYSAIHLLVSTENSHAIRLYKKAGFFGRAQCQRYDHTYYALERKL